MKIPNFIKIACGIALVVLLVLIFTPVPQATNNNTILTEATIERVFEGPLNDIVFVLKDKKQKPYINRGLERGLNIDQLNTLLKNQKVELKFIDHWTPLDYNQMSPSLVYIKKLKTGEVLFDNIKDSLTKDI